MKKIGFIFSHAPHGTTFGREGLDLILGISVLIQDIRLFFIGDGTLQLLKSYKPENILARDYIPAFSILSLYDIKKYYCCELSLFERGLNRNIDFLLPVNILNLRLLRLKLDDCDTIINF